MYPGKNDRPLFEESLQTSWDSFGWGYNSNKSWDVRLDSPKSGVSFLAVRTVVGGNILEVVLAVSTVVGGNILKICLAVRTVVEENILEVFSAVHTVVG